MKNKKGANFVGVSLVFLLAILVVAVIGGGIYMINKESKTQEGIGASTPEEVATATNEGDVAQIKVFVRNLANNNINTKIPVAVYCVDDQGTMVIDGTSSSASTEISGSTTRGRKVSCYAFNSTIQTADQPASLQANQRYWDRAVDEEIEHIVVDAYEVATTGKMTFYDDQLNSANAGASNITITGDGSDSFNKMRFENNNTDKWIPLGGFYFNTVTGTNISALDISGSATVKAKNHGSSTKIVESDLSTKLSSRKDNFDYVFEFDDDSTKAGNQPLILEESDYIETRTVYVESDVGCDAVAENLVTGYAFTEGWYRATKSGESLKFGHETDASSSSVITADITGSTFYCDN